MVKGVLKDNKSWIYHTFKKLAGEVQIDPLNNATYSVDESVVKFQVDLKNIGLQDWPMEEQGF